MALGSAALFGASTPLAKLLIGGIDPWLLAGMLYLGSGVGLTLLLAWQRIVQHRSSEASLSASDLPWLCGAVMTGGIIGPLLLMLGLATTKASTAALLLNLESLATTGIAWLVFRESVDRRLLLGAFAILIGALVLSWQGSFGSWNMGAIAIGGACLAWGIDNNLTRKISAANPVQIAAVKGLAAGFVNVTLAILIGARLPTLGASLGAGVVGLAGYGVSLVLFVLALRDLGAARTGAYFSTAPFVGAVLGVALFSEPITAQMVIAASLMAIGVWLHVAERHSHEHTHGHVAHEHAHIHDEHHQHAHDPGAPAGEPHSHWHEHCPMVHKHPHYPDLHHRHRHI